MSEHTQELMMEEKDIREMVKERLDKRGEEYKAEEFGEIVQMVMKNEWLRVPTVTLHEIDEVIDGAIDAWKVKESFTTEYEVGKLIINDEDDFAELIGLKIKAEILAYYPETETDRKKIGTCTLYVLDDREYNIYLAADAHSQRLTDMISNVYVEEMEEDKEEIINTRALLWSEAGVEYTDGEVMDAVAVAGKIALLDRMDFDGEETIPFEQVGDFILKLARKVNKVIENTFLLTDGHIYDNPNVTYHEGQLTKKQEKENQDTYKEVISQNEKMLEKAGFVRTGQNGYILNTIQLEFD